MMTQDRYQEVCQQWLELKAQAEAMMREYCEIHNKPEAKFLGFTGVDWGYGRLEFKGEEHWRGETSYHSLDLPENYLWTEWQTQERAKVAATQEAWRQRSEAHAAELREARRREYLRLKNEFEAKDTLPTGEG